MISRFLKRPSSAIAMAAFLFLPITSCKVELPKSPLVQTVAILPFDNESNDINASDIMQRLTYLAMKPSAYQVMDISVTNKKLADVGIVDGGQLPALDPVKIGKDFGVQALMYGSVESFDYTNIGYFLQRKAGLYLRMVDASTGQTIWENSSSAATRRINVDSKEAQKEFTKGLVDQLVDKLFKTPLEEEAKLATIKTLAKLPGFIFSGFAKDEQSPNTIRKTGKDAIKSIIRQQ